MKRILFIPILLALVLGGYLAFTTVDSKTDVVVAKAATKTYSGTAYVAGMGGHYAVAEFTIDPNDSQQPIKVDNLDRIVVGPADKYPIHDARIDVNDRDITYWSTYLLDPDGNLHTGISSLKTGEVLKDVVIPKPERAVQTIANYCASGQSKDSYIAVSMANEGYIDVRDKKTLELKHRIFMTDLGFKSGTYTFAHGTNTPDMTKFLLTLNDTPAGFTAWLGNTRLIMLDMAALEQGKIKKLAEGRITGTPGKTITFRQSFTPDGKYLLQSGADRAYLIDATTLKAIDEITEINGESHDLISTPDGKYALMTLRTEVKNKKGEDVVDGTLQLYDIGAKKVIGKNTSVCAPCHESVGMDKAAALCGLDVNWKQ
jgi:hypothetical protein